MNYSRCWMSGLLFIILIGLAVVFIPCNGVFAQKVLPNSVLQQFIPKDPIQIFSDNDFSSQGFPGSGTIDDPYRIEGFNISAPSGDLLAIRETSVYFIIKNNYLDGLGTAWVGILFYTVLHGIIENNLVKNFEALGIGLYFSSNNTIVKNSASNCGITGIRLESSSDNNFVSNNTAFNNADEGIWVGNESHNNTIIQNALYDNNYGIILGTDLNTGADRNTIALNNINNNRNGIAITAGSDNNNISRNELVNNQYFAVQFDQTSTNNSFKWNNLYNNNQGGYTQARDEGVNNIVTENYWADWISPDSNKDGIVDAPYTIAGRAGNSDPNPLASPYEPDGRDTTFIPPHILWGSIILLFIGGGLLGMRIRRKTTLKVDQESNPKE